jgi:hypothetical protein
MQPDFFVQKFGSKKLKMSELHLFFRGVLFAFVGRLSFINKIEAQNQSFLTESGLFIQILSCFVKNDHLFDNKSTRLSLMNI